MVAASSCVTTCCPRASPALRPQSPVKERATLLETAMLVILAVGVIAVIVLASNLLSVAARLQAA
jgi:hypothetical protein